MAMNEFADPGQEPPPGRESLRPARPAGQPPPPGREELRPAHPGGTPIRVRIVWDIDIPPPVTRGLTQAEQDWFGEALASRDPGPRGVQYVDFTLSAREGFVVDGRGLPWIGVGRTADVINVLLVPSRPGPFALRPYHDMGPGSPVRKPGFGLGP
jgi:hypothetical protein